MARVAVVTGGTRGIGRAISVALKNADYRVAANYGGNDQAAGSLALDAYFAPALDGPWTPHPLNPLKMDLSSARPAGRPFTIEGRLYRPAMDCSQTYGGAVQIMELVDLTTTRFRERLSARIDPDPAGPYPDGLHHLVVDGDEVYIDAKRQRYDKLLWLKNWWRRQ